MNLYIFSIFILSLMGCQLDAKQAVEEKTESRVQNENLINPEGQTVAERFLAPKGYEKVPQQPETFGYYLQSFKLKPHGAEVHYFNGDIKPNDNIYEAVLDIDVGKYDLQQCADAVMRLRAEYLYKQKRYNDIHFNFTSGFRAYYSKWRQGYRIQVKSNNCNWVKKAEPSNSYASFKNYLQQVFTYAGTLSLEKELKAIPIDDMKVGAVFIKGGSPGHAVIVLDMATNKETGEKLFLLGQSYMPAQEIHVLKNPMNPAISPWYSSNFNGPLFTPEWTFQKHQLKRF